MLESWDNSRITLSPRFYWGIYNTEMGIISDWRVTGQFMRFQRREHLLPPEEVVRESFAQKRAISLGPQNE